MLIRAVAIVALLAVSGVMAFAAARKTARKSRKRPVGEAKQACRAVHQNCDRN